MTHSVDSIAEQIKNCSRCPLSQTRTNVVPGTGNHNALIMFIGEGPGADEDKTGIPFVGKAGQLLTKILSSVEIKREDVFITNIVKCRPPGNRDPEEAEMHECFPFLANQIQVIQPRLIVTLGRISTRYLLDEKNFSITREHGKMFSYHNIPLIPVFHPSFLLHHPSREQGSYRYQMWEDMKLIKNFYTSINSLLRGETC